MSARGLGSAAKMRFFQEVITKEKIGRKHTHTQDLKKAQQETAQTTLVDDLDSFTIGGCSALHLYK